MAEFLLEVDVEKIEFVSEKLGEEACMTYVKIKNPSKDRYLFKIKCTSNELFRIRPPLGYIKPGETEGVKLIFNPGKPVPDSNKHYFVVYYRKSDETEKQARVEWRGKDPEAMKRLYIHFNKKKGDGKDTKKEKKEEKKDEKEEKKEEKEEKEEKKKEEKEEKKDEKEEKEEKEEKKEEKEEKKEEEKKDDEKKDEDKNDDDKKEE